METISNKLPTVAIYSKESPKAACSAIRLFDPISACNWNIIWNKRDDCVGSNFDPIKVKTADLIIIQRDFPCRKTVKILTYLTSLKVPIIYDLDDYLLDEQKSHLRHFYFKTITPYICWVIKEADIITVSTLELKREISSYTNRPILVNRNLINYETLYSAPRPRVGQINLLISGTPSHKNDWKLIIEPISEILKKYNNEINIIFLGTPPKFFLKNPSITIVNFERDYIDYAKQLRNINAHFALTPLEDTTFNRCKSNIKWLEYSAAGIPGIYSNLPSYNSCIKHNMTGLLVNNDPESWYLSIEDLIVNPEKSMHIAVNAQKEVIKDYSIQSSLNDYANIFINLMNHTRGVESYSAVPTRCLFSDTANIVMDKISILYSILTR